MIGLPLRLRGTWFRSLAPDVVAPASLDCVLHTPRRFGTSVEAALRGTLVLSRGADAGGLAGDRAEVRGTVTLALWPRPAARWHLEASGDPQLRLAGTAYPKVGVPIDSLTRLWLRVERGGELIGLCLFRFDLRRDGLAVLDHLRRGAAAPAASGAP